MKSCDGLRRIDKGGVQLEDLGSKNGTTINEISVEGVAVLRDGDRIAFGAILGIYRTSSAGISTDTHSRGARAN